MGGRGSPTQVDSFLPPSLPSLFAQSLLGPDAFELVLSRGTMLVLDLLNMKFQATRPLWSQTLHIASEANQ